MDLAALTTIWATLRQKLAEESGLDDDELMDTLDGELDLADRLRSLIRKRREMLANADALKGMISDMCDRKARMETTAKRIGDAVTYAMQEAGIAKLKSPDFSASVSYGKKPLCGVESLNPADLPTRFIRTKLEVDRNALRAALESGEQIEGAYLGNAAPFITVRTK
jgi:hypothetical protein